MDIYDRLRKHIRERMNDVADALANGSCTSFEEYKRLCGVIEGLAYAERDILDIKEELEKADQ